MVYYVTQQVESMLVEVGAARIVFVIQIQTVWVVAPKSKVPDNIVRQMPIARATDFVMRTTASPSVLIVMGVHPRIPRQVGGT